MGVSVHRASRHFEGRESVTSGLDGRCVFLAERGLNAIVSQPFSA
jgi:hypothetical protein